MKRFMLLLIISSLVLFVSACGGSNASTNQDEAKSSEKSKSFTLTSGTTTGVYYPLGALISTMWTNKLDFKVVSQASNGSVENLNLMKQGEADLGFSTVNVIWEAYNGEGSFKDNQYDGVRILANLYPNVSHIIAREGAGIDVIGDIKGKSFVLGAAASATEIESKLVLESHGVSIDDINANYVGFTEAVDLLRNKQVDAVNIYTGVPAAAATELISTVDSKVLSFSEDAVNKLVKEYPWNFEYTISANTYDKQTEDIRTVGQYSSIVIDSSVSEETVYELTKAIWENLEELKKGHNVANQFDPKLAVQGTADVPLHPGAEKYYKEIGALQ